MSVEVEVPFGQIESSQDGEVLNGNVLFGQDSVENAPVKEGRIIRKAKRPSKQSPRKEENALVNGVSHVSLGGSRLAYTKNSRKSRNARGRGLPKKGGAGGKGVWGRPGSEINETGESLDSRDPNYDSDSQENVVVKKIELEMTDEDLQKVVQPLLQEYLEHGDTEEVIESLEVYNIKSRKFKIPDLAVTIAMDRHDPQRELTSRLISDLYSRIVTQDEMIKGFNCLLEDLPELTLDTPDAPSLLGQFIARAIADDCLPPKFVSSFKGKVDNKHVRVALDKADLLLSMKHGIVRLDNVWGVGGGNRPVKNLVKRMVLLLKEYLSSGDIAEATRCLKDLDVPHFHHELVYEAICMAIEQSTQFAVELMTRLLHSLCRTNVVTPDQMSKGLKRIYDDMPDICLDVPTAYSWLDRIGNKLYDEGIMNEELYKDLPSRGRKRFVSEGDGGRVKEHILH